VALGWGVLLVSVLHRTSSLLALGRLPDASMLFDLSEVAFALALCGGVLLTGLSRLVWLGVVVLCLAPPLAGLARGGEGSRLEATARNRPDVVLIVIDTLRADHLPPNAHSAAAAPALEALAEDSIRFRRAYSPGNQTLLAMPGVLTSLSPVSVGRGLAAGARTLAEHLRDAGYATLAISGNPLVSARLGYDQGFQSFSDPNDWPSFMIGDLRRVLGVTLPALAYRTGVTSGEFYYRPVSEIRRRAVSLVARAPRPLFLYLHTMDMHGPYLPPAELLPGEYSQRDFLSYFSFLQLAETGTLESGHAPLIDNLLQRYAGEMRSTDAELGRLFDVLRREDRFEESLIWVLSDHGESFGEQGFAGHGGRNMTPSVLQVPLLLKPPRSWGLAPRDVETPVSTYDVLPTTLALLGLPLPNRRLGADLGAMLRGEVARRDITVVSQSSAGLRRILSGFEGPWKLDLELDAESGQVLETALYNVLADPEQKVDLQRAHPRVVAKLVEGIRGYLEGEKRAFYDTRREEFDDETLERLQRLGYVD
jgi:arylsulfatase A-like enzyme